MARVAQQAGSIPAGAGGPFDGASWQPVRGVYPRRRGGTADFHPIGPYPPGLSPQARGNRRQVISLEENAWSIPAGAGEPLHAQHRDGRSTVYPRRRGGTFFALTLALCTGGLSPQARGNLVLSDGTCGELRSIPAGAGEPIDFRNRANTAKVYPRRRGGTFRIG